VGRSTIVAARLGLAVAVVVVPGRPVGRAALRCDRPQAGGGSRARPSVPGRDIVESLDGKTAVVTGGASGMGRAFCARFARAGMRVVAVDIDQASLDEVVADLRASGAAALGVPADVARPEDHEAVLAAAVDGFGAVHVVCLNAGVGGANGPSWKLSLKDWRWTLDVNLWGVIHGIRTFVPHLLAHGDGHVVTTASIAGHTSSPYGGPYNVSKHGVATLTETLFHELQKEGSSVGVTCLCPGFVATNIIENTVRERPARTTARPAPSGEASKGAARFVEVAKRMLENGTPPADVADLVHDAILSDQFWLFTDSVWDEPIGRRHREIAERRAPTTPAPRKRD
jgi:NAD(P)-dependent dehydrogenase (short-subunit alcohol dehydrogenase family)